MLIRKDAFQWLGNEAEFQEIFAKQVSVSATELFCAPPEEIASAWHHAALAASKVPSDGSTIDPMTLLTPAQRRRAQEQRDSSTYGTNIFFDALQEPRYCSAGPFSRPC